MKTVFYEYILSINSPNIGTRHVPKKFEKCYWNYKNSIENEKKNSINDGLFYCKSHKYFYLRKSILIELNNKHNEFVMYFYILQRCCDYQYLYFFIDMMSCGICNRFWEKLFFGLYTRGAWRNQTKIAGKMDGSDSSKPRGIAGEKCAIRMPSFHCYSRWRATPETQFNQVRCNIGAALKIAT